MEEKCPRCGAILENGVCPYCGYESTEQKEDNRVNDSGTTIIQTVVPVQDAPKQESVINVRVVSTKSRMVTLLLCLFFGILGAHRFYTGKFVSGIIYLFTGGLLMFGWAFDLFMILIGGFNDSQGLPVKEW